MIRNFLYALLAVFVITVLIIAINWEAVLHWWNKRKGGISLSCQQQYEAAKAEWTKSGKSCILTSVDVVCPTDSSFVVSVNPCVEKILKDKGWKSPEANNSNNSSGNNNNSVQYDLQVSNPNGAFMYYQANLASGGQSYSKSNLLISYGTKLKLVNIWQTNVSTQPFAGYYETTAKNYGPLSGFFATQDIMKL